MDIHKSVIQCTFFYVTTSCEMKCACISLLITEEDLMTSSDVDVCIVDEIGDGIMLVSY